ncbi:MAG TPA: extracellular solute-binding protein [Patescibacteria group bacterium]|nr:extracellular solute-binding protein [Patescibacteria group bacterium]
MADEKEQTHEVLQISEETVESSSRESLPHVVQKNTEYQPIKSPSGVSVDATSKRKTSKILILLAFLVVLAGVALVWLNKDLLFPSEPKQVTLTYWGLWETEQIMKPLIEEYQKEHPLVTIRYERHVSDQYRQRLQAAILRGEGPDIFRFHNTWVPELLQELEPLPATVLSAQEYETLFYPVTKQDLFANGNYVGIPLEVDGLGLFYNEKTFQESGEIVPDTWDKLAEVAKKFTIKDRDGRIQTAGVALGLPTNVDHWSDILGLMMLQAGVDMTNPSDEEAAKALLYFTQFATTNPIWDETLPNSTVAFAEGKLAMYFGPSWRVFDIQELNPELEFNVAPVPQLPGTDEQSKVTWGRYWVEGVSRASKNKEVAWDFLKFLTSKESEQKLYTQASQIRSFGPPYSRKDLSVLLSGEQYVGPFIDQAPYAQSWYMTSNTFDEGLNDQIVQYFENAINTIVEKKTTDVPAVTEILAEMTPGIQEVLRRYGLLAAPK